MKRAQHAFTMIEMLIVMALVAIVLGLAAPSFREMIVLQRLKGINAQLVTDLQYARSEAVSRGKQVFFIMKTPAQSPGMSCYTLYTDAANTRGRCNCAAAPGARCDAPAVEVKTAQIPTSLDVRLGLPAGQSLDFAFDPTTGGIVIPPADVEGALPNAMVIDTGVDAARALRTVVSLAGRPSVCLPTGSRVTGGFAPCP